MASKRIWNAMAVIAIAVALFATLGEASPNKTDSGSGKNNAPNAGATSGPSAGGGGVASNKATPIPVGTAKEVAKGWSVKVNLANLDADALLLKSNQFNKPQPGEKFVLVNVTVTNGGDKPESAFGNLKLSYLPPSGVALGGLMSCMVSAPDKLDSSAQMQPGAVATGNVCFSVKIADIPNGLLLAEPQFTVDKVKDQQFFALA